MEDPVFCELDRENDRKEIEKHILDFMMEGSKSQFKHPKVAIFILGSEANHKIVKEVCMHYKVPS